MLVLRPRPFLPKSSNFSMMALTFVASVFRADFWGGFLGHFSLTWHWILALRLDLLLRRLCGYLAILMVFFVQLDVDST